MARERTPQRFSGRAGANLPGRVRRALDAQVDTGRRVNESLEVDRDGRLGAKVSRSGGLRMGTDGLELDPMTVGDKNLSPMGMLNAVSSSATLADLIDAHNALLAEMRRTKRMR